MTRLCVRDEDVVALFAADCGRFVKRPYGFVRIKKAPTLGELPRERVRGHFSLSVAYGATSPEGRGYLCV